MEDFIKCQLTEGWGSARLEQRHGAEHQGSGCSIRFMSCLNHPVIPTGGLNEHPEPLTRGWCRAASVRKSPVGDVLSITCQRGCGLRNEDNAETDVLCWGLEPEQSPRARQSLVPVPGAVNGTWQPPHKAGPPINHPARALPSPPCRPRELPSHGTPR